MEWIAGRPKLISTNHKCEEFGTKMIKTVGNQFVCTSCGLEQQVKK